MSVAPIGFAIWAFAEYRSIFSTYTMKIILIVATIFAVIPPCLVFMMKDIRFGDQQNDVEGRAPGGDSVDTLSLDDGSKKQPLV